MEWHEGKRIVPTDKWFVLGGNPDGNGGGVIASTNDLNEAESIRTDAVIRNYRHVVIRTWKEMMVGHE